MNERNLSIDESTLSELVPVNALTPEHRRKLIEHAELISLDAGQSFSSGVADSDNTYYVLEGELGLYAGDRLVGSVSAGSEDARFALNRLRSAQIHGIAKDSVTLLRIDVSLVSTMLIWMQISAPGALEDLAGEESATWMTGVLGKEIFSQIPPANVQSVFKHLESVSAKSGDEIIKQGDPGDYYYIIRKGNCSVTRSTDGSSPPVQLAQLGPGDSFGEEALVAESTRNATVSMLSDGVLMRLTKEDFRQLIIGPALAVTDATQAEHIVAGGGAWIDARLAEEHANNGIPGSLHIPLADLRDKAVALDRSRSYVIYSNSGGRSMAGAFLLTELGFSAQVLAGGLLENPDVGQDKSSASAQSTEQAAQDDSDPQHWSAELERASEDMEAKFLEKLEATSERRLLEAHAPEDPQKKADARLISKRKKLELESASASAALAQAQRRKLEVEAKLRSAESDASRRRAEAEAACENLRLESKTRLRAEEDQLQARYAQAASKLQELKKTREETEERLRKERERLEAESAESQQTLQLEASKIKEDLERVRRDAERKAEKIRADEATEEDRVRHETEVALRDERQKLEVQFARSVAGLEKAQQKLKLAESAKSAADQEAKRVVAVMRESEEKRRTEAEEKRLAERAKLEAGAEQAKGQLAEVRRIKEAAETRRRAALHKLARLRSAGGDSTVEAVEPEAATGHEQDLRAEIDQMDASVSDAMDKLDAAQRAKDDADAIKLAAAEKAAVQRATEEELRVKLHEEAEDWLREEQARSQAQLDKAKAELAEKWSLKEVADKKRRDGTHASETLLDDISSQLSDQQELQEAIGEKAYAEEKTQLTLTAQEEAAANKAKAIEGLKNASEHIARLRRQGLLD